MPSSGNHLLLKGGTILIHEGTRVKALKNTDILIEGSKIAKIGSELALPAGGKLVDCANKIVSPGFVDTHHHLWQSQLKGRHGDQTFMDYMVSGNFQSFNYQPQDIFWGQLAGCLESLDGGVTTVVDHAHMTYSPEHATEALRATASSGLRSVFCYTPIYRVKAWSDEKFETVDDLLPDWWHSQLESLCKSQPFGDGRVHVGLAFDLVNWPKQTVVDLWEKCRKLGTKLMTVHYLAASHFPNVPQILRDYGLLKSDVLLSHATGVSEEDAKIIVDNDVSVSSTPDTELQMGLGDPVAFRSDIKSHTSLGVDCHSNNSSDLLTQIRLGMQHARATEKSPSGYGVSVTLEEAFNLGTIKGARAANMKSEIGSLAEGKLADIVVFDAVSPSMACAAQENPLAAVLLHASVRDIDMVIVGGEIRKEVGKLSPVGILDDPNGKLEREIQWSEVAGQLLASRDQIVQRSQGQGHEVAKQMLMRR